MTRLSEAPHGWVEDFLRKAASAGLSAEHLKMLNSDPHLLHEWIASLPDIERPAVVQKVKPAFSRVALTQAFPEGGTAVRTLVVRMGINWLDDLASLCEMELISLRAFGTKRIARIQTVLSEHGLELDTHPISQCRYFPSRSNWPLRRAQADMVSVTDLADLYNCLTEYGRETVEMFNDGKDRKTLTLGKFRRMSDEARLELITPAGINKILDVVDRYQL